MSKTLINKVIDYIEDNDFDNDEIKKFIDDVINKDNPTIRTISNRYSLIKKNIKEKFLMVLMKNLFNQLNPQKRLQRKYLLMIWR